MKTYADLKINNKINCKGNLENRTFVFNSKADITSIMLDDCIRGHHKSLFTVNQYKENILFGQNLKFS